MNQGSCSHDSVVFVTMTCIVLRMKITNIRIIQESIRCHYIKNNFTTNGKAFIFRIHIFHPQVASSSRTQIGSISSNSPRVSQAHAAHFDYFPAVAEPANSLPVSKVSPATLHFTLSISPDTNNKHGSKRGSSYQVTRQRSSSSSRRPEHWSSSSSSSSSGWNHRATSTRKSGTRASSSLPSVSSFSAPFARSDNSRVRIMQAVPMAYPTLNTRRDSSRRNPSSNSFGLFPPVLPERKTTKICKVTVESSSEFINKFPNRLANYKRVRIDHTKVPNYFKKMNPSPYDIPNSLVRRGYDSPHKVRMYIINRALGHINRAKSMDSSGDC